MRFLQSGGQLWAFEAYWTQVGIATGHSAAIADFNWNPAHISVSNFGFSSEFNFKFGVFILCAAYGHYDCFLFVIFVLLGNETDVMPMFDRGVVSGSSSSLFRIITEAYCSVFGASEGVLGRVYGYQCSTQAEHQLLARKGFSNDDGCSAWS